MSENHSPALLVTGASGHLGRRVIELLLEAHAGQIIAATRTPEKLADFSQRGVLVRHADFDDPASLAQAFAGVDRLLLISTDAVGVPGHRLNQHRAAVKAAEEAGVKHVLYTSIANVTADSPIFLAPDHYGTEAALTASKLGWTMLRNNIYADGLIPSVQQAVQSGHIFSAAAEGRVAYITREDCARAAAAALTSSFDGRRTLEITGPEALSQGDIAAIATDITGKQITYVPIDLETLIQGMVSAGLPQPMAEAYATFDTAIAQGLLGTVTNAFADLTGKHPTRVADFLAAHRDAFVAPAG